MHDLWQRINKCLHWYFLQIVKLCLQLCSQTYLKFISLKKLNPQTACWAGNRQSHCIVYSCSGGHKDQAVMNDICPSVHPGLISLKGPVLLHAVNTCSLGSLTSFVSLCLSCVSQSRVSFLRLWRSPPNVLQPACHRPLKKRGALFQGPPGVVSDGEAVPVVLCIQ